MRIAAGTILKKVDVKKNLTGNLGSNKVKDTVHAADVTDLRGWDGGERGRKGLSLVKCWS